MAETNTTRKAAPAKRTASTRKSAARKPAAARRSSTSRATAAKPAATRRSRSTAVKAPSASQARRSRTIAANETREAATANVRAARTTVEQGRNVAERAALVYVGATLEARDRAISLVGDLRDVTVSRRKAEQQISRLERRGKSARTQVERDVRKARTRVERELRGRRRGAESVVQAGVTVGERIASTAKERVAAIA
jgi:hypothetical protein